MVQEEKNWCSQQSCGARLSTDPMMGRRSVTSRGKTFCECCANRAIDKGGLGWSAAEIREHVATGRPV